MPADRGGKSGLIFHTQTGTVPKGARKAVVTIVITRLEGKYNDGSVDNVALVLANAIAKP
jgi:hypothetical protein